MVGAEGMPWTGRGAARVGRGQPAGGSRPGLRGAAGELSSAGEPRGHTDNPAASGSPGAFWITGTTNLHATGRADGIAAVNYTSIINVVKIHWLKFNLIETNST